MTRNRATLIGFTAILMWALLALRTIGSSPGSASGASRPRRGRSWRD